MKLEKVEDIMVYTVVGVAVEFLVLFVAFIFYAPFLIGLLCTINMIVLIVCAIILVVLAWKQRCKRLEKCVIKRI